MILERSLDTLIYGNGTVSLYYLDERQQKFINLENIDIWTSEQHSLKSKSTSYPIENGSTISDNIYLKPRKLILTGFVSNIQQSNSNSLFNVSNAEQGKKKVMSAWAEIKMLQETTKPLVAITTLEIYGNDDNFKMYITSTNTQTINSNTGTNLEFTLTLEQIKIVSSESTRVNNITPSKVAGSDNDSKNKTSKVKAGKKNGKKTDDGGDLLQSGLGWLKGAL